MLQHANEVNGNHADCDYDENSCLQTQELLWHEHTVQGMMGTHDQETVAFFKVQPLIIS